MNARTTQRSRKISTILPYAQPTRSKVRHTPDELDLGAIQPKKFLATIESIATGTPDSMVKQSDAARVVGNLPHLEQNRHRIEKLYSNTRIDTRHLAANLLLDETLAHMQKATIQDRMQLFKQHAVPLAEKVTRKAIESAAKGSNIQNSIRQIVFVSSTGFIAPGVDTELIKLLGLRRDIARVTVNFMGCAAAMNGLRVASDYVRANPTHKALVVCLELSSVNAVFEDEINDVIIQSIFGDGCAAVVVGACDAAAIDPNKIVIRDHLSYLVEETEDGITLGVQENGITCKLSRQLPDYIEAGVNPIIERFLASNQLTKANIDLWAIHPGGVKIIERSQRSLGLDDSQVADSWAVLRQYGNMLSPSVLFVLERMLCRLENEAIETNPSAIAPLHPFKRTAKKPEATGIAFSFSPGVGVEGILFQKF